MCKFLVIAPNTALTRVQNPPPTLALETGPYAACNVPSMSNAKGDLLDMT